MFIYDKGESRYIGIYYSLYFSIPRIFLRIFFNLNSTTSKIKTGEISSKRIRDDKRKKKAGSIQQKGQNRTQVPLKTKAFKMTDVRPKLITVNVNRLKYS